jgi:O-acetyl-ADP-ribose deacetylase (regulator of RNase III)
VTQGASVEVSPGRFIDVVEGDITRVPADAIVNAANSSLAGGGGVDGAIHRAGGPSLMDELRTRYGPDGGRHCPTGSAVPTSAGKLPARWVIHAVGPRWRGGTAGEPDQLASTYRVSIEVAQTLEARTIAFPAISCGIYGYPLEAAAEIALRTVAASLRSTTSIERATFVLFSGGTRSAFASALERISAG